MNLKLIVFFLYGVLLNAQVYSLNEVDIQHGKNFTVYKKDTNETVTGLLKIFYDDNKTIKELFPLENGKINGIYKSFYRSGKLRRKIDYKNSKRNGKDIIYYENGKKNYIANMNNDLKNGIVKEWYRNGKLKYNVLFKNNKANGIVKIYDENGSIESINKYKEGKIIKQIKPKKVDNILLQTRATIMYGNGKDIYYLFVSPICPHCKDFIKNMKKYEKLITFYIYVIPLNPKNTFERKLIDIIYSKKSSKKRFQALLSIENNSININQKISMKDLYYNNFEIIKSQQIQMIMNIKSVPMLIDTKGFKYNTAEFEKKYNENEK